MTDYACTVELNRVGRTMTEPFTPDLLLDTLSGLGAAVEDDERGEAVCPRVDFSVWATSETESFIGAFEYPDDMYVNIYEYDAQFPTKRFRRFTGKLIELPRRGKSADEDVFIFSATGFLSTYSEVDVVDSVSGGAYRDTYFEDLIPALVKAAGHPGGLSVNTGTPIKTADRWTSRLFYPGKHRFGGSYVLTDKITAICNDGTSLYFGVGHWLCRYDPATREARKLARLDYTGSLPIPAWNWRIVSITKTGGTYNGWAESITPDLKDNDAHVKIKFTYVAGDFIDLTDANRIDCYDRGYYVKSSHVNAVNDGGPSGTDVGQWRYKEIGDSTPPTDKTLGLPIAEEAVKGGLYYNVPRTQILIKGITGIKIINKGDVIILHSGAMYQEMGRIVESPKKIPAPGAPTYPYIWEVKCEFASRYLFTAGATDVYVKEKEVATSKPNLALPGYRYIRIEYEQGQFMGSPKPIPVKVERRRESTGRTAFYWPEILADANEWNAPFVPGPYIALGEGNIPRYYKTVGPDDIYIAEAVPNFWVKMEDTSRFANLPAKGYWVENAKQPLAIHEGEEVYLRQPGENVLMYNGAPVKIINEGGAILSTRGNIYLATEGNSNYVAWNRWRWAEGWWFLQIAWGKLDGATVKKVGRDRWWTNYNSRPPRELTGFKVHNGKYYFGIKRVEPRWRDTAIQIIWAAPPQGDDKPTDYNGGLIAVCMVTYDKTEYLSAGDIIRVRSEGKPVGDKEYLISEVEAIPPREITATTHSYRTYTAEVRTYFVLFALEAFEHYAAQAKFELADKYITIQEGYDIRGEICYADGQELKVGHTATAQYGEAFDGQLYDWEQQEWHGEPVAPELDYGPIPWTELAEERVVPGSLIVTLRDGKKDFTITDKTDELRGELPIPPLGEVYVKYKEGDDAIETRLYFNPAYLQGRLVIFSGDVTFAVEGTGFDVEYEFYTDRLFIEPFVLDGALYFNETETGAIYRRNTDTSWTRAAAWPAPIASVSVLDKDVYALAENDFALMKYGKEWPGYINEEVGGADPIDIFNALTKIAQAADCFLGEENGRIMFRPREQSNVLTMIVAVFEDYETVQYKEQKQYRGVLITYANGKAYAGQNDPPDDLILKRSAPYVNDYGLAYELASRYYIHFTSGAVIYDVETARNGLHVPILAETVDVGKITGRLMSYELHGLKIGMLIEKTAGKRLAVGD